MLVFDKIVYSLQKSGGISRFWSKITEPYLDCATFVERSDTTTNIYRREQHLAHRQPDHPLFKTLSRYRNFGKRFADEPYVFHSSYYRVNSAPGAINVTTIHDLIYERFGSGIGSHLHILQKRRALAAADCIVCVSEHTRKDLHEYYPVTRDKRVIVIPNGVDPSNTTDASMHIPSDLRTIADSNPNFLYVGHRGECKGFDRVYQALTLCPTDWRCVVVGDWLTESEKAAIESHGLTGRVISVGRVSDTSLTFLYGQARFLFFPSLYEGFGIPPLEAMQQGCPVLASNCSSVPEVVGDAAILFDPNDPGSIAAGIRELAFSGVRDLLIEKGHKRAAQFSWQSAVDAYRRLYEELLNTDCEPGLLSIAVQTAVPVK